MREIQTKNLKIQSKFETAVENLKRYHQGTTLLETKFPKYAIGQRYTKPFQRLRIQNSDFQECRFEAPIVRTNISGSKFEKCIFDTIDCENSTLQYGSLYKCKFNACNISGSNFSNCFMEQVTFDKSTFMGTNFLRSHFENCRIQDGEMLSSSLEFAEFQNTYFENLRLANLSLEYSEFSNVHMENVVLPFAQLPFIFGGLDYILSTHDKISISANLENANSISVDEYIQTFEDWKVFFYNRELYFPLANILLSQRKKEEALQAILNGILMMVNHSDYRMLKYLCKLAASHESVSKTECKMLYSRIQELIMHIPQNPAQQYSYEVHMNDIKNILVENPKGESRLYLSVQTNILVDNQSSLYRLVSFFEMLLDCTIFGLTTKTISIRHDSPYEIIIIAIGALYLLNKALETISNTFKNIRITADDIMAIRNISKNSAKNNDLDNQLKAAALQKEKMEIQKLALEIEQLQAEISKNNIQANITHNIKEKEKIYLT